MNTLEQYIYCLNENQQQIVFAIISDIKKHDNVQEIMLRNIIMYRFSQWWIYINCHKRKDVVLGFGRGNKMVLENPMLKLIFDEVKIVVAKVKIQNIEDYNQKSISKLIDLCRQQ